MLAGLGLEAAAVRLFSEVLHRVGLEVCRSRGYRAVPSSVVFHLPMQIVAALFGCSDRHLRRLGLVRALEAAGVLVARAHREDVRGLNWRDGQGKQITTACTGALWAVKLRPDAPAPRLRREDWAAKYRDFIGDRKARRTVKGWVSAVSVIGDTQNKDALFRAAAHVAANPRDYSIPGEPMADAGLDGVQDVREIAYRLGDLNTVHASRRAALVSDLAGALCRVLDGGSGQWRALWARTIWRAWSDEGEGRNGLQALALALCRVAADTREWEGLRSPGALLAARLRVA